MEGSTVGIIGLGAMGRPICRHLVNAGYHVLGYDPHQDAGRAAAKEANIKLFNSPKDVASCSDIVIILVGFESQVETVIFGDDGIMAGARSGLTIGLSSTVSPSYAYELPRRTEHLNIGLLDIPTTRSQRAAEEGSMLVLGAGEPNLFERYRPLIETFAVKTDIFNLGAFGAGQVAKMVNNMILWACMSANHESLKLGERFGIDQETMRDALVRSSASNFALVEKSDLRPIPWAEKDLTIAQSEADRLRMPIPVCGLIKETIKAFKIEKGYQTPGP